MPLPVSPRTGEKPELLAKDESKDLLRIATSGSVDDGKSTLIGRLLYESKGIYEDQLHAVEKASGRMGSSQKDLDLALVTDGLKAEREQGITIDVAYRYFSTPKRKFIIADTPGHEQYTRNMATGASTADLAIVLVDARHGVLTQSRRHAFIAALLGIPHLLVTINKMDLVEYSEERFEEIVDEFREFAARLELKHITFIPISALEGDNVVNTGTNMPWYRGRTLLDHLETIHIASDRNLIDVRFPVQVVTRPDLNFRGYMGTPASGIFRPGDEVIALPSGRTSKIRSVHGVDGEIHEAYPPLPVTITLEDEIDVSRGDVLVPPRNMPHVTRRFEAMMVWMADEPMQTGRPYMIKHLTRKTPVTFKALRYGMEVDTLRRRDADSLALNEIGRVLVETSRPIAWDPYRTNRTTGAFVVIDRQTHGTVAAGMMLAIEANQLQVDPDLRVEEAASGDLEEHASRVTLEERKTRAGHPPATLWLTGLTGSGKSTIAYALERRLHDLGMQVSVLDGSNMRLGVSKDLGFSPNERAEHNRRAAEVARLLNQSGIVTICAFQSPYRSERRRVREMVGPEHFYEVHLAAPIEVCRERDTRGLYARADRGEVDLFPGVSAPYEEPEDAELVLATHEIDVETSVDRIIELLEREGIVPTK